MDIPANLDVLLDLSRVNVRWAERNLAEAIAQMPQLHGRADAARRVLESEKADLIEYERLRALRDGLDAGSGL